MRKSIFISAIVFGLSVTALTSQAQAAGGDTPALEKVDWSFSSVFGTYKSDQLRRGFTVYQNVCAACHGLKLLHYRNLAEIGLSIKQIKAIAADQTKKVVDDDGEEEEKPREIKDRFPDVTNKVNNKVPPDLSLVAKARLGGPNYLYSLLVGYKKAPAGKKLDEGQFWNAYFPGHVIAMAPPLTEDGQVEYTTKGAPKATVKQMAQDVTAFLMWAAEPNLGDRKRMGIKVLLFLLIFTAVLYAIYRRVWRGIKH